MMAVQSDEPGIRGQVDGETLAFAAVAGALIVAGGLVAAVNGAAPFAHGSWLAAYLVLVGGVAQLLLGVGCLWLPAPRRSPRLRRAQLVLWNGGNTAVAAGVLADLAALVVGGSAVVLVALGCFAFGAGHGRPGGRARMIVYGAVIAALAVSVVIGSVLADAVPSG